MDTNHELLVLQAGSLLTSEYGLAPDAATRAELLDLADTMAATPHPVHRQLQAHTFAGHCIMQQVVLHLQRQLQLHEQLAALQAKKQEMECSILQYSSSLHKAHRRGLESPSLQQQVHELFVPWRRCSDQVRSSMEAMQSLDTQLKRLWAASVKQLQTLDDLVEQHTSQVPAPAAQHPEMPLLAALAAPLDAGGAADPALQPMQLVSVQPEQQMQQVWDAHIPNPLVQHQQQLGDPLQHPLPMQLLPTASQEAQVGHTRAPAAHLAPPDNDALVPFTAPTSAMAMDDMLGQGLAATQFEPAAQPEDAGSTDEVMEDAGAEEQGMSPHLLAQPGADAAVHAPSHPQHQQPADSQEQELSELLREQEEQEQQQQQQEQEEHQQDLLQQKERSGLSGEQQEQQEQQQEEQQEQQEQQEQREQQQEEQQEQQEQREQQQGEEQQQGAPAIGQLQQHPTGILQQLASQVYASSQQRDCVTQSTVSLEQHGHGDTATTAETRRGSGATAAMTAAAAAQAAAQAQAQAQAAPAPGMLAAPTPAADAAGPTQHVTAPSHDLAVAHHTEDQQQHQQQQHAGGLRVDAAAQPSPHVGAAAGQQDVQQDVQQEAHDAEQQTGGAAQHASPGEGTDAPAEDADQLAEPEAEAPAQEEQALQEQAQEEQAQEEQAQEEQAQEEQAQKEQAQKEQAQEKVREEQWGVAPQPRAALPAEELQRVRAELAHTHMQHQQRLHHWQRPQSRQQPQPQHPLIQPHQAQHLQQQQEERQQQHVQLGAGHQQWQHHGPEDGGEQQVEHLAQEQMPWQQQRWQHQEQQQRWPVPGQEGQGAFPLQPGHMARQPYLGPSQQQLSSPAMQLRPEEEEEEEEEAAGSGQQQNSPQADPSEDEQRAAAAHVPRAVVSVPPPLLSMQPYQARMLPGLPFLQHQPLWQAGRGGPGHHMPGYHAGHARGGLGEGLAPGFRLGMEPADPHTPDTVRSPAHPYAAALLQLLMF
jgi:hypothetical protein